MNLRNDTSSVSSTGTLIGRRDNPSAFAWDFVGLKVISYHILIISVLSIAGEQLSGAVFHSWIPIL